MKVSLKLISVGMSNKDRLPVLETPHHALILGQAQSIEIATIDSLRRRNSSPLPTLTSSVDEPSSSEDDSFGSVIELPNDETWDLSKDLEISVEGISPPTISPRFDRTQELHQDSHSSSSSSSWTFSSLFPTFSAKKASEEDHVHSPTAPNFFCGAPSWCLREPYQASPIATEKFIDVNSKTTTLCNQWSYWNMIEEEDNIDNRSTHAEDDRYSAVSEPPRNRSNAAFVRRKERIENLRFNLAPFDAHTNSPTTAKCGPKQFPSKKILSFTAVSGKVSYRGPEPVASFTTVRMCGGSSSHPVWDSEITEEDGLCYDSDPGFLMPNRRDEILQTVSPRPKNANAPLSCTSFDEEMSMKLVMNHHFNLVWHRESPILGETAAPTAVRFWMERGSCIRSSLIQPKLCWKNIDDAEGDLNDRMQFLRSTSSLETIELLDITKILPMKMRDKSSHPLAKKRCSFIVEASNNKYLFQAKDENERDRIILGLKVTISLLGSKIIMGDPNVFEEFFTPKGNEVPGDMPSVLRN